MNYLGRTGPVYPSKDTTPPKRCTRCGEFLNAEGECVKCEAAKAAKAKAARIAPNRTGGP